MNDEPQILNARIKSTFLGFEDHGILTFYLHLDIQGGDGQGFGGWAIRDLCIEGLGKLLRVVGVDTWEQLPGKHVRIERKEAYGTITAIGHIIEDKWFSLEGDLK